MKHTKQTYLRPKVYRRLIIPTAMLALVLTSWLLFVVFSKRLINIGKKSTEQELSVTSNLNETANNGIFELTVSSPKKASSIKGYFEPNGSSTAICLPLKLKNISGEERKFIPLEEVKLVSSSGQKFSIEMVPSCAGGVGGPTQVGEVLEGELGFILPNSIENKVSYSFQFSPIDKNTKSVIIRNVFGSEGIID